MKEQSDKIKFPLKHKMVSCGLRARIPLLCITIYLIIALLNYSSAYDEIVSRMTIANGYNLNFKEEMDESLYKLVVGAVTFDTIREDKTLKDPYLLVEELYGEVEGLMEVTTDKESRVWLSSLLRNLDTLKARIDDIKRNLDAGRHYDQNIVMLDNNIYILTELIQDDIQYYIYYQTQSIEDLKIQLNTQIKSFLVCCCFLVVVIFIIAFTTAMFILTSITKPIRKLCKVTEQIAEGDFSVRAEVNSQDELAILADSVNDMSENLEVLVEKIKEDERKMRYAELRLLQEQINPHFLYNTLDTIVWLIEGNDPDKAVNMVVSLSEFFRLVLSKGKEYITIKDEELHIKSYLEIQQVRYRDILEYEIDIDPELYSYRILKLTLQPLVENSLYHGIKYKRAKGKITVKGHLDGDRIILTVSDNGVGMEADALARLQEEITRPCKETSQGFGLANVNERIRMNFGMEYGMTIQSVAGEGTTIQIVIPAVLF